jgi:hypothetical protein
MEIMLHMHLSGGNDSVNYVNARSFLLSYNEFDGCFDVVCEEGEDVVAYDDF